MACPIKSNLSGYRQSPDTIILAKGFYQEAETLFGGLLFDGKSSARVLLKVSKTMIIPSGAMFHCENALALKNFVSKYTRLGGTVVFFTQQYGEHIEGFIPIPADEIIKCTAGTKTRAAFKAQSISIFPTR
ncbi:MAG: hypothetical protein GY757_38025 [bacterium]|nr:hypothetical protein [bacterium]